MIITGIDADKGLRSGVMEDGQGVIHSHVLTLTGAAEDFEALGAACVETVQMMRDIAVGQLALVEEA